MSLLPSILLLDDSADDRELVSLVLRGAFGAVDIEEVTGAAQLARAMVRARFGAVLTEHELPWIDARDVLRLVRDLRPGCPVLVLTRHPVEGAAAALLHLAPDALLPKTARGFVDLPSALEQVLRSANPRAELATEPPPPHSAAGRASTVTAPGAGPELAEMAYAVSHDLRQPLHQVMRLLELLARAAGGRLEGDAAALLEQARNSAERLDGMFEAVLRCARIENASGPVSQVDLEGVLVRVLERLEPERVALGAEVTHAPLPTVRGDEAQLEQLLQNLLDNALKYHGREPARIHVETIEDGDYWHLVVRDNGIGIPSQDRERVFRLFQRLHTAREVPGSGIGLALCRRVVERHGGRIWVESTAGSGSSFHFTLAKLAALAPAVARME